jgi:hypothetical protein
VAGEVGGRVAAGAGELRLVAVEHGALVPTRHGGGLRGFAEGRGGSGGGVIEVGFGGKAAEVLAGGEWLGFAMGASSGPGICWIVGPAWKMA